MIPFTNVLHCTKQKNTYAMFYSTVTTKQKNKNSYSIPPSSIPRNSYSFSYWNRHSANQTRPKCFSIHIFTDPHTAEMLAATYAVSFSKEVGFFEVIFEGDALAECY
jgi:hypothetical protein